LQRSSGAVRVSYKQQGAHTVLDTLYQQGCYQARLPRNSEHRACETILINTAGGLTDDDELCCQATWQASTTALLTTQAAERIYRSRGAVARIRTQLDVGDHAVACWLPQETIIYDSGRLDRCTEVDMAAGANLLAVESVVFGRTAMGEAAEDAYLLDRWRLRIGGKLVFADAILFDSASQGPLLQHRQRRAIADGATAMATIVYVGPDKDRQLDKLRTVLQQCQLAAAVSDLGALLVARMLAASGQQLRAAIVRVFTAANDGAGLPTFALPRVWNC